MIKNCQIVIQQEIVQEVLMLTCFSWPFSSRLAKELNNVK